MNESRYSVEGVTVEAKSPEQAARKVFSSQPEGVIITVVEWTGKVTKLITGRKGRLKIASQEQW